MSKPSTEDRLARIETVLARIEDQVSQLWAAKVALDEKRSEMKSLLDESRRHMDEANAHLSRMPGYVA